MQKLPPIPSPPEHLFREFRIRLLPGIVFVIVLAAVVSTWRSHVSPTHVVGQVDSSWSVVASPKAGNVTELKVQRFERVNAGDPLVTVITTDPNVLRSTLAVIKAEAELIRVDQPAIRSYQRVLLDYERLRLDLMNQKIELAMAKIRLQQAESEYGRVKKLFQNNLLPEGGAGNVIGYDVALRDRDVAQVEVQEKQKIVADLERSLNAIVPDSLANGTNQLQDAISAAIAVQEEKLRLAEAELNPVVLRSPIDGLVREIDCGEGQFVTAGAPLLKITSLRSDRVVAFVRQPLNIRPEPGMEVLVKARNQRQTQPFLCRITKVGAQLEQINKSILDLPNRRGEMGLPILIELPPELKLLPGELVDLTFQR